MPPDTYTKERAAARKADKPCAIRVDRRVKSLLEAMPEDDEDLPIRLLGVEHLTFKIDPAVDKRVHLGPHYPLSKWDESAHNELRAHAQSLFQLGLHVTQIAEIIWVDVPGIKALLKMSPREIKGGAGALHAAASKMRQEAREALMEEVAV